MSNLLTYDQKRPCFDSAEFIFNFAEVPKGEDLKCDEPGVREHLFGLWENFQRLEAYFLRSYFEGRHRKPFFTSRARDYQTADLHFCSYSYQERVDITENELKYFSEQALANRKAELRRIAEKFYALQAYEDQDFTIDFNDMDTVFTLWLWVESQPAPECRNGLIERGEQQIDAITQQLVCHDPVCYQFRYYLALIQVKHQILLYTNRLYELMATASNSDTFEKEFLDIAFDSMYEMVESLEFVNPNVDYKDLVFFAHRKEVFHLDLDKQFLASPLVKWLLRDVEKMTATVKERNENSGWKKSMVMRFNVLFKSAYQTLLRVINSLSTQQRRSPFLCYEKFGLMAISDLQLMKYIYDRVYTDPVKSNYLMSHITWDLSREEEGIVYNRLDPETIEAVENGPGFDKDRVAMLRRLTERYTNDFSAIVPAHAHFYDYIDIMNCHALNIKYLYSDMPTASAIQNVRDLKMQQDPFIVSYKL